MCGKCVDKPFHLILAHFRGPLDYRSSGPASSGGFAAVVKKSVRNHNAVVEPAAWCWRLSLSLSDVWSV